MKYGALKIAGIYLVISLLWIFLSDKILFSFENLITPATFLLLSSLKGFFFVLTTAFLLFKLIQAEHRRLISKDKDYRVIFQSNPNPMWVYDPETLQFISVNDAAIEKYGYPKNEFLNMTILDIRPVEDRGLTMAAVKRITDVYSPSGIWRHVKKDGSIFYVSIHSHKVVFNGKERIMTLAMDTTEKVLFEQQLEKVNEDLAEQKRILSETQHIARIAGWEYYIEINQLNWSDEIYLITNIKPTSGKTPLDTYFDYIYPEDKSTVMLAFEKLVSTGAQLDMIHRIKMDNQEIRYIRQLARMEYSNHKPFRLIGSMQDVTELKVLEIERNKYLYSLDDTINTINDIFFAINRNMEIIKTNDKFLAAYQLDRNNLLGRKILDVFPSAKNTEFYKAFKRVANKREIAKLDDYAPLANKWYRMAAYPTEEGAAVYLTDITEQKQKDIQLREAVERYDFVAEATNDVIYDFDIINDRLSYNTSVTGLINVKPEEIKYTIHWWRSRIHPDDVEEVILSQQKVINEHGSNWECEYRIKTSENEYKYVSDQGHFLFDERNNPVRLIGSVKDIDDLKRSIEENKRLAGIITRINNMVIVMDAENKVEWVNKAFEDFTGYSLDELEGKYHGSFMRGPDTSPEMIKLINQKQAKLESFSVDLIKYTKAGQAFWVNAEFTPTFDQDKRYTGYIGVYQNITQRKESQEALQRQNNVLREIAWISSHEVRRPVASILGLINLFRLVDTAEEKEELMVLLEACTKELDTIVHSINNKVHDDINLN